MTKRIDFDPESLTLGEMEDIEEASGVVFGELITMFESQKLSTRGLRAVMWILLRREDPDLTFEATRDLTVADINAIETSDSDTPLVEVTSGPPG